MQQPSEKCPLLQVTACLLVATAPSPADGAPPVFPARNSVEGTGSVSQQDRSSTSAEDDITNHLLKPFSKDLAEFTSRGFTDEVNYTSCNLDPVSGYCCIDLVRNPASFR